MQKKRSSKPRVLAVCAVNEGAASARAAVAIGSTLAISGFSTILVDLSLGSRPESVADLLDVKTPRGQTVSDYLSGDTDSLEKITQPTRYRNLTLIESGIDYISQSDKSFRLTRGHFAKFSKLAADYLILDLGLISDHIHLEYLSLAKISLAVMTPAKNVAPVLEQLAANMAFTSVELKAEKRSALKKAVATIRKDETWKEKGLFTALSSEIAQDVDLDERLLWIQDKTLLHIATDRSGARADREFAKNLADRLTIELGINTIYAGGLINDEGFASGAIEQAALPYLTASSPAIESGRAITRVITGEDIPVDEALIKKAEESQNTYFKNTMSLMEEEVLREKENFLRVMKDELAKEREEKRDVADTDLLSYARGRRHEIEEAFEEELSKRRESATNKLETELELTRNKRLDVVEEASLAAIHLLRQNMSKEIEELRESRLTETDSELATIRVEKIGMLEKEIDAKRTASFAELEHEHLTRKVELEGIRSAFLQETEEKKTAKLAEMEEECHTRKVALEKEIEDLQSFYQTNKAAMEKELEEQKEELASFEDLERQAIHARCTHDVEHIKEMVWQELEESREKKIKEIDQEINRLDKQEREIFRMEIEAFKEKEKEKVVREQTLLAKSLLDRAHRDVMLLSSFADVEYSQREKERAALLNRKFELERDRLLNKLNEELASFRQKTTEETLEAARKEKITIVEEAKKKLAIANSIERKEHIAALRKETTKKRLLIGHALLSFESKQRKKIDIDCDQRLLEVEKDVNDKKIERMREVTRDTDSLKERMIASIKKRLATEELELKKGMEDSFTAVKNQRIKELDAEVARKRERILDKTNEGIVIRRSKAFAKLTDEIDALRKEKKKVVAEEVSTLKAGGVADLKKALTEERSRRINSLKVGLARKESAMRKSLSASLDAEEKEMREKTVSQLEIEREKARKKLMTSLNATMLDMELDFKQNLDNDRSEAYRALEGELSELRSKHEENTRVWAKAEKKQRLKTIKAKLKRSESSRLRAIEERLLTKQKEAIETIRENIERKKQAAISSARIEIDTTRADLLVFTKKEAALLKDRLNERALIEIEAEKEERIAEITSDVTNERKQKTEELNKTIEQKRATRTEEMERLLSDEKKHRMAVIQQESEALEAAITESLEKRRKRLYFEQEEWVRLDGERLKIETSRKIESELVAEKKKKRLALELIISDEEARHRDRMNEEEERHRIAISQREEEIRRKASEEENQRKKEFERWSISQRGKFMDQLKNEKENRLSEEKDNVDQYIEKERFEKIAAMSRALEKERINRLEMIESEVNAERAKRLDLLNLDLKTEEYRRRQDLIAEIMEKKADLDESFQMEKKRYFDQLRDEILKHADLNRELFDEEIKRVAKNLRLN